MTSENARARLERELRRLVFAESDMKQVAAATTHLVAHGAEMNGDAERTLQTGVVVTYARAYVDSRRAGVGAIKGRLAQPESPALGHLHDQLLQRRNDLFAHNDETPWRAEVDIASHFGTGTGEYVEAWTPVDPAVYPEIERLATAQRDRFSERRRVIEDELRSMQ